MTPYAETSTYPDVFIGVFHHCYSLLAMVKAAEAMLDHIHKTGLTVTNIRPDPRIQINTSKVNKAYMPLVRDRTVPVYAKKACDGVEI
jgi:hypothetical protein